MKSSRSSREKTNSTKSKIKYISAQNVVIHTENCKLELLLDFSVTQVETNIRRMCGLDESSRRRGFADFSLEVFYIDFIEGRESEKPPLCLELKKNWKWSRGLRVLRCLSR